MKNQAGLTLIELMVTITIAAILLAVGAPSFQYFMIKTRMSTATSDLASALNLARSEAVRRGVTVSIRNTSGGGNWGNGWTMFVDNDKDGTQDVGDETLRVAAGATSGGVTVRSGANFTDYISYSPSGRSNNSGNFAICHNSDLDTSKPILVNAIGRIRVGQSTEITSCTAP